MGEKITNGFMKHKNCDKCDKEQFQIICFKISIMAHKLVRDNPSVSNITKEISKRLFDYYSDLKNENFCDLHIHNFVMYAANKCIQNCIRKR